MIWRNWYSQQLWESEFIQLNMASLLVIDLHDLLINPAKTYQGVANLYTASNATLIDDKSCIWA